MNRRDFLKVCMVAGAATLPLPLLTNAEKRSILAEQTVAAIEPFAVLVVETDKGTLDFKVPVKAKSTTNGSISIDLSAFNFTAAEPLTLIKISVIFPGLLTFEPELNSQFMKAASILTITDCTITQDFA